MSELIHVKLPDGSVKDVPKGTSALDIAKSISSRLADAALAAQIRPSTNGDEPQLVDLTRPLNQDVELRLLTERDPEALAVYRHSSAHLLAAAVLELFPENRILRRWIELARKRIKFQGLPARICWLGYGERAQFGLAMNDLVKKGKIKAPIVIGRDHLDCGSVASPFRETESMKDGSDAVADWPLLNALLNTAAGASWVSIHNGGGVGIGYSLHAGQVTVADGTEMMAKRIERVLTTDPGMGIIRHSDAGYDEAKQFAKKAGVKVPME